MKTREQIEEMAKEEVRKIRIHGSMITPYDVQSGYEKGFIEAYTQAQQDLINEVMDGFHEWFNSEIEKLSIMKTRQGNISLDAVITIGMLESNKDQLEKLWQAARLSMMKSLQDMKEENEAFKKEAMGMIKYMPHSNGCWQSIGVNKECDCIQRRAREFLSKWASSGDDKGMGK